MTYLISCVSKKVGYAAPAKDLYISVWFRKAREFAFPHPWFIISAKYGLVAPDKVISPYDVTLLRMPKKIRKLWSAQIIASIITVIPKPGPLVFLAGNRYREFLVPELEARGYRIEVPMGSLTIGKQLQKLGRLPAHDRENSGPKE